MNSVKKIVKFLMKVSLIKTLCFNFYHFNFKKAIKIPVLISNSTKVFPLGGKVLINNKVEFGMIKIGLFSIPIFEKRLKYRTLFRLTKSSITIFNGKFNINNGVHITSGGEIIFGDNFAITGASRIICDSKIIFGNNFLMSWDCQILDNDFHKIYVKKKCKPTKAPIEFGDNVWIGHNVLINKGSYIPNNCVVASGSIVNKRFTENNILLAGTPAKIVKSIIKWEK